MARLEPLLFSLQGSDRHFLQIEHLRRPASSCRRQGRSPMKKTGVIIQLAVISMIIIYSTVSLFMGNFEAAYTTFPVLFFFYIFVVAKQKHRNAQHDESGPDDPK